ncbi:MAG: MFS transporter [Cyanothece sp. SIO1E1]|nr:MFS transporter [Cyanothece sp. SIO1E1]
MLQEEVTDSPQPLELPELEETTSVNLDESRIRDISLKTGENFQDESAAEATGPPLPPSLDSEGFEVPEQGFWPVLKNRNFLALWSGQVFSQLADKVYLVLMIALIASQFQGKDQVISGWVSAIMIAFTIPAVLFGSLAGVFVDRWSKKAVLVVTNLLRGGLVLLLPLLLGFSQSWTAVAGLPLGFCVLLAITFLVSTLTQFFAPAEQSAIPLIVERRHLLSANSLYTTTMMASVIIGFAVGEPLLAIADTLLRQLDGGSGTGKEILVGVSYGIAGLILLLIRAEENLDKQQHESAQIWTDIQDGLRYLRQQSQVQCALWQLVILFSIFAALAVLAVRLAETIPDIQTSQFGFLLAAGGVGMALGATIVGQFGQRFSHFSLSLYGSFGIASALVGLSFFTRQLWPTLSFITLLGISAAMASIPMQTTIQQETPEAMRGKVFGLQNNAVNIALSLPLALAGMAEAWLGLRVVFLMLAVFAIAGGVSTWYISDTGSTETDSE